MQVIFPDSQEPVSGVPPTPPPVIGIDVNFCKNPVCANFGVPANIKKFQRRKGKLAKQPGSAYSLVASGKNRPALKCLLCGERFNIKSNLAVAEELTRFARYLLPEDAPSCPSPVCANHGVPVTNKRAYVKFGMTNAGTPRWRCRKCGRTVAAGGRAMKKQRITHLNKTVLLALTNKMPIRRIAKVTGLNAVTLYGKIDYLYRQCVAFAAAQERKFREFYISRLYISVDRQDYAVNWSRDTDRRNIILRAAGSADNTSGFVFGMHLSFDPDMKPEAVEEDADRIGDVALPYPHRKYARLWLLADYEEAQQAVIAERVRRMLKSRKGPLGKTLGEEIADAYEAAGIREDSEVSELRDEGVQKLPETAGMQVHEEYSLYGHFQFLKRLLPHVGNLRFYLDQDSGMRAACFAAFAKDIQSRRVDAFYVKLSKDLTVDKKRAALTKAKAAFKAVQDERTDLTPEEVKVEMMKAEIERSVSFGKWNDCWCAHPAPNMSEPNKAMCWLTPLGGYDEDHHARLFLKASLAGIDNFFQRVRRSVNPLERPIHTASKSNRTWYGYNPYNPKMVVRLLEIYRVMHNYVERGKDGKTPAQRLDLASKAFDPEDILYFTAGPE